MALQQLLKCHPPTFVHPKIRRSQLSRVVEIALIDEVLEEGSNTKLLIFRHLCDLSCELRD